MLLTLAFTAIAEDLGETDVKFVQTFFLLMFVMIQGLN